MRNNWTKFLVVAVVLALASTSALATCTVTVTGPLKFHDKTSGTVVADPVGLTGGHAVDGVSKDGVAAANLSLNATGVTERIADILISDDGAAVGAGTPFCFSTGNHIVLTINGLLTDPAALGIPANIDQYDSNGSSGITTGVPVITPGFAANQPQTVIDITIQQAGTVGSTMLQAAPPAGGGAGAVLRIKNLRVNAAGLTSSPTVTITVSGTGATTVTNSPATVGTKTVTTTGVVGPAGTATAPQSCNGCSLVPQATFSFTEGFGDAFRVFGTAGTGATPSTGPHSGVANDRSTTSTSLVLSVAGIPGGTTVTFPSTVGNSAGATVAGGGGGTDANNAATWNCAGSAGTGGGLSLTPAVGTTGTLTVICTTQGNGTSAATEGFTTANTGAPTPGNILLGTSSQIGVTIGAVTDTGVATVTALYGPSDTSQVTGDDVQASAVPRYTVSTTSPTDARKFMGPSTFFTLTAVRTTLLMPFVFVGSAIGHTYDTGVSVANTALDTAVFADVSGSVAGQSGGLKFYYFANSGATFVVDTTVTALPNCSGLVGGRLAPGHRFGCSLGYIMSASGNGSAFDGYVIVGTSFVRAHGNWMIQQTDTTGPAVTLQGGDATVLGDGKRGGILSLTGAETLVH